MDSRTTVGNGMSQLRVSFLQELRECVGTYTHMLAQYDRQASMRMAYAWTELSRVFEVYVNVVCNPPQGGGGEAAFSPTLTGTSPYSPQQYQSIAPQPNRSSDETNPPRSPGGFPVILDAPACGHLPFPNPPETQPLPQVAWTNADNNIDSPKSTLPIGDLANWQGEKLWGSNPQVHVNHTQQHQVHRCPLVVGGNDGTTVPVEAKSDAIGRDGAEVSHGSTKLLSPVTAAGVKRGLGTILGAEKPVDGCKDILAIEDDIIVTEDGTIPAPADMKFDKKDEAMEYIHKHAYQYGYQISISNSAHRSNCNGLHTKYFMPEKASGNQDSSASRDTHSRTYIQFKCVKRHSRASGRPVNRPLPCKGTGCTFTLYISLRPSGWVVKVSDPEHNHKQDFDPSSIFRATRVHEDIREFVWDLIERRQNPRQIMDAIDTKYGETYNESYDSIYAEFRYYKKHKFGFLAGLRESLDFLTQENCHYRYAVDQSDCVTHLFFACNESIKLARTFPHVVLIGCAEAKDKHDIPLVRIMGVNNLWETFTIAIAFVPDETNYHFEWVLKQLLQLYDADKLPQAIVTDRDRSLSDSVAKFFGNNTRHLLCHWYINMDISRSVSQLVQEKTERDKIMEMWSRVVDAATMEKHSANWMRLKDMLRLYPEVLFHLEEKWMPLKEKFVRAYIDDVFHLDMVSPHRGEEICAHLTADPRLPHGNFLTFAKSFVFNVKKSIRNYEQCLVFERNRPPQGEYGAATVYGLLLNKVALKCLSLLDEQRILSERADLKPCSGKFSRRMGIPCRHKIKEFVQKGISIALIDIHKHWWLDQEQGNAFGRARNDEYIEMIVQCANSLPEGEREDFYKSVFDGAGVQWNIGNTRKARKIDTMGRDRGPLGSFFDNTSLEVEL